MKNESSSQGHIDEFFEENLDPGLEYCDPLEESNRVVSSVFLDQYFYIDGIEPVDCKQKPVLYFENSGRIEKIKSYLSSFSLNFYHFFSEH